MTTLRISNATPTSFSRRPAFGRKNCAILSHLVLSGQATATGRTKSRQAARFGGIVKWTGTHSILRRPLDLGLVIFFALSILYALLDSLPEAIGYKVAPDSPWPPLRSLYDWAVQQEPQHLNPPTSLIASTLFDGFIQTPILFFVIWGLVKMSPWIRTLSLIYAGAAVTNMFMYFVTTFIGPNPPPQPWVYLPFNLPWMIVPAILGWRMLPKEPFAKQGVRLATA